MGGIDLGTLSQAIDSPDVETTISAVDEAARICQELAQMAADALGQGCDTSYFIAERLYRFGSLIIDPLKRIYRQTSSEEVKTLAAIVLLRLGSRDGVEWLLSRILPDPADRYLCLICRSLASSKVREAANPIISRLRAYDTSPSVIGRSFESNLSKDTIVCLFGALDLLDVPIPDDLRRRYSGLDIPVEISRLVGQA